MQIKQVSTWCSYDLDISNYLPSYGLKNEQWKVWYDKFETLQTRNIKA